MSVFAFEHPILSGLFGDQEIAEVFSFDNEFEKVVQFEVALTDALFSMEVISPEVRECLLHELSEFVPDVKRLRARIRQDGVIMPAIITQMREKMPLSASKWLHHGATSQDVVDTVQMSRLYSCLSRFEKRISKTLVLLDGLDKDFGSRSVAARTRMQIALPQTVSSKVLQWRQALLKIENRTHALTELKPPLAFGGPVGDLRMLGKKGAGVRAALAANLNMRDVPSWHTDRMPIMDVVNLLASISNAYGKIGLDFLLMAQNEVSEVGFRSGGASSAMPHKQNPIQAEAVVSLSRFASVLVSGLNASAVHEFERSGVSWNQEWLMLPQLCMSIAAMMSLCNEMITCVESFGE